MYTSTSTGNVKVSQRLQFFYSCSFTEFFNFTGKKTSIKFIVIDEIRSDDYYYYYKSYIHFRFDYGRYRSYKLQCTFIIHTLIASNRLRFMILNELRQQSRKRISCAKRDYNTVRYIRLKNAKDDTIYIKTKKGKNIKFFCDVTVYF